jgi:tRNA threonylcarbamoyladenosine biosynthesis protein TsaB
LSDLMARCGVAPGDITALAVTLGPGSYTGLRIGMSLAKGLAMCHTPPLPLIGIPTLDVLAAAQPQRAGRLCAVAKAGRGRVNAGLYVPAGQGWLPQGDPFISTWEALAGRLERPVLVAGEIDEHGREVLGIAGDGIILSEAASGLRRAGFLAELACVRLAAGATTDAALLIPIYLS